MRMKTIHILAVAAIAMIVSAPVFAQTDVQVTPTADAPVQADIQMIEPPVMDQAAPAVPPVDAANPESVITVTEGAPDAPVTPINPDVTPLEGAVPGTAPTVAEMPEPVLGTPIEKEINEQIFYLRPSVDVNTIPSLFFSRWEHDLLIDARNTLNTRPPGDALDPNSNTMTTDAPRDVQLGGIVYHSSKEWTIWLNNTRITPDAIPNEVMDLKVFKDYIQLEWFDSNTNQIFPIRLRTHQRFNLDARIFLPG